VAEVDAFDHSGSPLLPQGLTAGLQLHWLQRSMPDAWSKIHAWLPYPQYWAWWFSGVMASEVSSLGCHTALWSPQRGDFSDWARQRGIAELFAPLRSASDVLGCVRPALAQRLGLADDVQVHVGSHDSNACLARYLCRAEDATVLSTGTWTIAMAAGASIAVLDERRDQLVNVAVNGAPVPTARFMGGREFAALCAGADPALADEASLRRVLAEGWMAHPAFAASGGPFIGREGRVSRSGQTCALGPLAVPTELRPALASLYCAEVSALLLRQIGGTSMADVIVEGPLADNPVFGLALAALLAPRRLCRSNDALEGTARGAWLLARWPTAAGWQVDVDVLAEPEPLLAQQIRSHAAEALNDAGP
jgi:L-fuculokinase